MITYANAVNNVKYPFIVLLLGLLVSLIISSATSDPKTKQQANIVYNWFTFLLMAMVFSVVILPGWDKVRTY